MDHLHLLSAQCGRRQSVRNSSVIRSFKASTAASRTKIFVPSATIGRLIHCLGRPPLSVCHADKFPLRLPVGAPPPAPCIRQTLYPRNRRRSTALTCRLRFSFAAGRASWALGMGLMKRPVVGGTRNGSWRVSQRPRLLASTRAALASIDPAQIQFPRNITFVGEVRC